MTSTQRKVTALYTYLETLTDAVIVQTKMEREPDDIRRAIRDELHKFAIQIAEDALGEIADYGTKSHSYATLEDYTIQVKKL